MWRIPKLRSGVHLLDAGWSVGSPYASTVGSKTLIPVILFVLLQLCAQHGVCVVRRLRFNRLHCPRRIALVAWKISLLGASKKKFANDSMVATAPITIATGLPSIHY